MQYASDFIFDSSSGIVKIWVPSYDNHNAKPSQYTNCIKGILIDDPQIHMQNNFQTLSELDSALSELNNFQQVMGANNLVNYIPASVKTWQGTDAIKLTINFYLVTFSKSSNIMGSLKKLAELAALHVNGDLGTRFHGGFRMQLYSDKTFLGNEGMDTSQDMPGTCKISINRTTQIQGMLLTDLRFNPSTVVCRNNEPLYYNVSASFVGYRPPLVGDLTSIFGGSR